MLRLAGGGPFIKKRFEVAFNVDIGNALGTYNYDQSIAEVSLDRAIIITQGDADSYGSYWNAPYGHSLVGLKLQSSTTARAISQSIATSGQGPWSHTVKGEVIEFAAKPKSLQYVVGNGTTSQSIAPVDPTKALLLNAFWSRSNCSVLPPSLGASAVTWPTAFATPMAVWVVEF
jgi:hypothetical protein